VFWFYTIVKNIINRVATAEMPSLLLSLEALLRFSTIWILFFFLCAAHTEQSYAQKKKAGATKTKVERDTAKPPPVVIIHETKPVRKKRETEILHLYETKETVIKIKNPAEKEAPRPARPGDTVIVIKKGKTIPQAVKDKSIRVVMDTGYCECVEVNVKAQDTVDYGQYVNYSFLFKNKCRDVVYIHSASFGFKPYNYFKQPVKVIRKISFVKRFDLPEFVIINPKDSFEFRFADDAFFEYDLHKSQEYTFKFVYSNSSIKSKANPKKTYLCTKVRDLPVFVK
jgi:hypothetical protein